MDKDKQILSSDTDADGEIPIRGLMDKAGKEVYQVSSINR